MLHQLSEKCKSVFRAFERGNDIFIVLLIVLVGFGGFGLGRLSKITDVKEPVRIIGTETQSGKSVAAVAPSGALSAAAGQIVASAKGSKYHFPWCSGAARISEANKIWFTSEQEARAAGYEPASNCPGLNGK